MKMTNSNIREMERAHYIMQLSGYFTELVDLPGVRFAYTDVFSDVWYNQAYDIYDNPSGYDEIIRKAEKYFAKKDRASCFYTSPATSDEFISKLKTEGYVEFEQESWMVFPTTNVDINPNNEFSVSSVGDDFSDFSAVYKEGLPGPEVDLYIEAAVNGCRFAPGNLGVEYLVAYHKDDPVGMLGLVMLPPYAGVYAVATLSDWQRRGVATLMNAHASKIAYRNNCTHLVLQTVSDEDSESKFVKMGYTTLFKRSGYALSEVVDQMTHG